MKQALMKSQLSSVEQPGLVVTLFGVKKTVLLPMSLHHLLMKTLTVVMAKINQLVAEKVSDG